MNRLCPFLMVGATLCCISGLSHTGRFVTSMGAPQLAALHGGQVAACYALTNPSTCPAPPTPNPACNSVPCIYTAGGYPMLSVLNCPMGTSETKTAAFPNYDAGFVDINMQPPGAVLINNGKSTLGMQPKHCYWEQTCQNMCPFTGGVPSCASGGANQQPPAIAMVTGYSVGGANCLYNPTNPVPPGFAYPSF